MNHNAQNGWHDREESGARYPMSENSVESHFSPFSFLSFYDCSLSSFPLPLFLLTGLAKSQEKGRGGDADITTPTSDHFSSPLFSLFASPLSEFRFPQGYEVDRFFSPQTEDWRTGRRLFSTPSLPLFFLEFFFSFLYSLHSRHRVRGRSRSLIRRELWIFGLSSHQFWRSLFSLFFFPNPPFLPPRDQSAD